MFLQTLFKEIGKKEAEWTKRTPNKLVLFGVITRSCTKVLRAVSFVHSKWHIKETYLSIGFYL